MNNLSFCLSKRNDIKGAENDSIIVLKSSDNDNIPLNKITDFEWILKKIFDGIEINGKQADFSRVEDSGWGVKFDDAISIPEYIFTDETLKNICRLLSEAAGEATNDSDSNKYAIELAGKINDLLKQPAILENFAYLVSEGITPETLIVMAGVAGEINRAIAAGHCRWQEESAIATVISRMDAREITKKSMKALVTILRYYYCRSAYVINALFSKGKITADTLINMAACAKQIDLAISYGFDEYAKSAIATVISRMDAQEITEESMEDLVTILGHYYYSADEINALFLKSKVTANRLKIMADHDKQIYDIILNVKWEARPAIGAVISRIGDDQIAEGAIEVLAEILNKSRDRYWFIPLKRIEKLFQGDGQITVKMLEEIPDLTRKAPSVISPLVVFEDFQSVPAPAAPKSAQAPVASQSAQAPAAPHHKGSASRDSKITDMVKRRRAADQQKVGVTSPQI